MMDFDRIVREKHFADIRRPFSSLYLHFRRGWL